MILLEVAEIKKRFGPEPVLAGASFELRPGDRAGLVGPNGSGKTTLLRIIAGREEADLGKCVIHASAHLGYLEQQPRFDPQTTLHDVARGALADLVSLQRDAEETAEAIAQSTDPVEQKRLSDRWDHLQQELHQQDAYNLEHRVERVLDGLRFRRSAYNQPVASLSGGEQNRLMLAALLLAEPNVMILDEPSNHLDIEATEWLEGFLSESTAAMIIVSHDRYFLDRVTNRTLELFQGTIDSYTGNFSAYRRQKEERLLVERRTYEKQQIEIAKGEEFIRRNFYSYPSRAEDRRKKLERIKRIAPPREIAAPAMSFPPATRSGDIVTRVEGLAKSFDRRLFAGLSFDILRGQCWALIGPNGSGKTTLLRCLLGLEPADEGRINLGTGVVPGYFDQQLAALDDDRSVVEAVDRRRVRLNEQQRRGLLARFGLVGGTALQKVGALSGGERCRAALARLSASEANLLVFDEPTNHLDLWARDALEKAILEFNGTVLLVSHDRYLVNRVADHLLVIEEDRVRVVEGNYDTYRMLADRPAEEDGVGGPSDRSSAKSISSKNKPSADKPARKRRFSYRKVEDLEAEIAEKQVLLERIERQLLDPAVLRDGQKVREIKAEIDRRRAEIDRLHEHWDEAVEFNW